MHVLLTERFERARLRSAERDEASTPREHLLIGGLEQVEGRRVDARDRRRQRRALHRVEDVAVEAREEPVAVLTGHDRGLKRPVRRADERALRARHPAHLRLLGRRGRDGGRLLAALIHDLIDRRLDDGHREAALRELVRRGEARHARAEHHDAPRVAGPVRAGRLEREHRVSLRVVLAPRLEQALVGARALAESKRRARGAGRDAVQRAPPDALEVRLQARRVDDALRLLLRVLRRGGLLALGAEARREERLSGVEDARRVFEVRGAPPASASA
ncbi:MAG: hypothetical protein U0326_43950 [Polyangiales bacterium]